MVCALNGEKTKQFKGEINVKKSKLLMLLLIVGVVLPFPISIGLGVIILVSKGVLNKKKCNCCNC